MSKNAKSGWARQKISFPAQVFYKKYQYIGQVANFEHRPPKPGFIPNASGKRAIRTYIFIDEDQDVNANLRKADKFRNMVCRHDPGEAIAMIDIS
ncbi:MAG: hypothetical protein JRF38_22910 [Deltaproteobacteria bacterium]|nr:hypothetical protein [Deltaproteobacteria bacterium]